MRRRKGPCLLRGPLEFPNHEPHRGQIARLTVPWPYTHHPGRDCEAVQLRVQAGDLGAAQRCRPWLAWPVPATGRAPAWHRPPQGQPQAPVWDGGILGLPKHTPNLSAKWYPSSPVQETGPLFLSFFIPSIPTHTSHYPTSYTHSSNPKFIICSLSFVPSILNTFKFSVLYSKGH